MTRSRRSDSRVERSSLYAASKASSGVWFWRLESGELSSSFTFPSAGFPFMNSRNSGNCRRKARLIAVGFWANTALPRSVIWINLGLGRVRRPALWRYVRAQPHRYRRIVVDRPSIIWERSSADRLSLLATRWAMSFRSCSAPSATICRMGI